MNKIVRFKKRNKIRRFLGKYFSKKYLSKKENEIYYFDNGAFFYNTYTREHNIPLIRRYQFYIPFIGGKWAKVSQIDDFYDIFTTGH